MTKPRTQESHGEELEAELALVSERTRAIAAAASPAASVTRPPGGGWSVAEVFEHLVLSTGSYLEIMRPRIEPSVAGAATSASGRAGRRWKPSFMGGILIRSLRSRRRLPAPRSWRIATAPRAEVIREFLAQIDETRAMLRRAVSLDWRAVRLRSPLTPLIRLDLGDCLTIITVHANRHLGQAERALATIGVEPRAGSEARAPRPGA